MKPTHLKTPGGNFDLTGAEFIFECYICHTSNCSPFVPLLPKDDWHQGVYSWFVSEKYACPLCRPDLYVFETDGKSSCRVHKDTPELPIKFREAEPDILVDESVMKELDSDDEPEIKPMRFVGHLHGCFAKRWQDNNHCSCWRVITTPNTAVGQYEIVGLPIKLRGDYD